MKKFWRNKKFWIVLFGIIILGVTLYFLFFRPAKIKIPEKAQEQSAEFLGPISSIYRYDFQKREYIFDEGGSWQNTDFTRYIYDLSQSSELKQCYYFLYDNTLKRAVGGGQRKCNSKLTITVGENKNCPSQGKNACTLYVYAVDLAENQGRYGTANYNIDWQKPEVSKIYLIEGESYPIKVEKGLIYNFKARVRDNTNLGYCWFYLDGKNSGLMKIQDSIAAINFIFSEGEFHEVFTSCADYYEPEKEDYLNVVSGEVSEVLVITNHPPEISSCRVTPTQGVLQTEFKFQVEVSDPDGDELIYNWNFGDGENSSDSSPLHYYPSPGNYAPEIFVSDGKKGVGCTTAWVVVTQR